HGVDTTPTRTTLAPMDNKPATSDASSISPDILVSLPIITVGLTACPASTNPPQRPILKASSGVSSLLATPLTPSVPKYFPIPSALLYFPLIASLCILYHRTPQASKMLLLR